MPRVVLYRRRISLTSGVGPLMHAQARALEAQGLEVELAAARGRLESWLRAGRRVRSLSVAAAHALAAERRVLFVDHSAAIPEADLAFVHNLEAAATDYVERDVAGARAAAEAEYFRALGAATPVVANSELVKRALIAHYGLAAERIRVLYPGYCASRFRPERRAALRAAARRTLGLADDVPLLGFVTSGDFEKRGLDLLLAAAAKISKALPAARYLVVGSRRLPAWAARDPLCVRGALHYRRKNREPERWIAALDLFVYPARYEEFGLVVTEAQALGVPVLTSRRVGAAETLPPDYGRWLLEAPEPDALAACALELLAEPRHRASLAAASLARIEQFDDVRYARASVEAVLEAQAATAQKR